MENTKVTLADLGVKSDPIITSDAEQQAHNTITPDQVAGVGTGTGTESVNIADIAAFTEKVQPEKIFEQNEMQLIDEGIERVKKDLTENVIGPLKDQIVNARIEAEADAPTRGEEAAAAPMPKEAIVSPAESKIIDNVDLSALGDINRFAIDDSDLKDLLGEEEEDATAEDKQDLEEAEEEQTEEQKKEAEADKERQMQLFKNYQGQIRDKIKVTTSDINLKEFKVSTKPISITKVLRNSTKQLDTAQWGLPNTNRLVTFSALSGEEITNLNPENFNNRMQAFRTAYSIMYNHLVDANKPTTLEAWLKTICAFDIDHLHFGLDKATFAKTNYLTYNCPVCTTLELVEKHIDSMVKYPNAEIEGKFKKLLANGEDTTPSALEPKLVPISDDYAISFRAPSIYGLIFETSALDEEFTTKYADILSILAYIENVYLIDKESMSIIPIDTNPVPDNVSKTVRRKVVAYYNIIKQLHSDQYSLIGAEINTINKTLSDSITYQIPEHDCTGTTKDGKKCTHHFEAEQKSPLQLLFSRHQLATIGSY